MPIRARLIEHDQERIPSKGSQTADPLQQPLWCCVGHPRAPTVSHRAGCRLNASDPSRRDPSDVAAEASSDARQREVVASLIPSPRNDAGHRDDDQRSQKESHAHADQQPADRCSVPCRTRASPPPRTSPANPLRVRTQLSPRAPAVAPCAGERRLPRRRRPSLADVLVAGRLTGAGVAVGCV